MAPKTPVLAKSTPENIVVQNAVEITSRREDGGPEENHDAQKRLIRDIALANPKVLEDVAKNFDEIYKSTGRAYTGPYAADEAQPHRDAAEKLVATTLSDANKMGDKDRIKAALGDLTNAAKENITLSHASGSDRHDDRQEADRQTVRYMAAANPDLAAEASAQLKKDGAKEAAALIDQAILDSGHKLKQANMGGGKHVDASTLQTPAAAPAVPNTHHAELS